MTQPERSLWSVRRDDSEARAVLRVDSFGRELRLSIDGDLVFRRLLDHGETDEAAAEHLLRVFNRQGWSRITG